MQSKIKFGYSQTGGSSVINKNKIDNGSTFFADFKIGDENIEITNQKIAIKIDVEGHEFSVLKGSEKILKKYKPVLLIEIDKQHSTKVKETFNYLEELNYESFYFDGIDLIKILSYEENIRKDFKNFIFKYKE